MPSLTAPPNLLVIIMMAPTMMPTMMMPPKSGLTVGDAIGRS
jgi:hypothetical protein